MKPRIHTSGFTLLEILVVLVITGFISSILFQALDQIYKLQGRFGVQLAQSQQGAMYTDWFRQLVQGLQTDYLDGKDKFQGSETQFTGLTTSPLSTDYGAPTTVTLGFQYDNVANMTRLLYTVNDQKMVLSSWPGRKARRFVYVDGSGDTHDSWPPTFGVWPQLPNSILLQSQADAEPQLIAAVPRGSLEPKNKAIDLIGTPF